MLRRLYTLAQKEWKKQDLVSSFLGGLWNWLNSFTISQIEAFESVSSDGDGVLNS